MITTEQVPGATVWRGYTDKDTGEVVWRWWRLRHDCGFQTGEVDNRKGPARRVRAIIAAYREHVADCRSDNGDDSMGRKSRARS